ncbi:MAG: glycosyltransferase [Eubacteriales bacterium]|nr:glycosyltransferase [Eubacteriales bacterium]
MHMMGEKNTLQNKYEKKVCMYTGALHEKFGVKMLADAFLKANIPNSECHFYDFGDCSPYLEKLMLIHKNIKYFGMVHNDLVVEEQMKATLLINPRFTNEEYTKYSFPSKNIEYMASGTSVLTTRLPGMPKEFADYVYIIDDETKEGLAEILANILAKTREELHAKGMCAKEFILRENNNLVQTKKIIDMLKDLVL